MPTTQTASFRVEALRARLTEKREKAAFRYDRFSAKHEDDNDISLPSVSLRAMLERVKLSARESGAITQKYN